MPANGFVARSPCSFSVKLTIERTEEKIRLTELTVRLLASSASLKLAPSVVVYSPRSLFPMTSIAYSMFRSAILWNMEPLS